MTRRIWWIVALAAGLFVVATLYLLQQAGQHPLTPAVAPVAPATSAPATTKPPASTPATPDTIAAATTAEVPTRPVTGYDRYRKELERERAARHEAQDLKANERCIGGQRFRKVGNEWEQTGTC